MKIGSADRARRDEALGISDRKSANIRGSDRAVKRGISWDYRPGRREVLNNQNGCSRGGQAKGELRNQRGWRKKIRTPVNKAEPGMSSRNPRRTNDVHFIMSELKNRGR